VGTSLLSEDEFFSSQNFCIQGKVTSFLLRKGCELLFSGKVASSLLRKGGNFSTQRRLLALSSWQVGTSLLRDGDFLLTHGQ
jgi:hypothetical protein